ncbi:hypothetical protein [Mycolicibacterium komossense]|uniref:Uncharacterized protein n=1 Tax=Mycolicibacterium komossense TaxID=1779 RepID=A0ABT3CFN0_9MYCO|nr:hypothetical protein [Mycolicibacterium komossense]MCV7228302.1 hypothetical protein [Mycolicibacterium komossense]
MRRNGPPDQPTVTRQPNIVSFFQPKPNIATYNKLPAAAYTAIKGVQPSLTVISAGLSPAVDNGSDIAPVTFVKGIYSGGANKYLDALAMHPYTYPSLPNDPTTASWSAFQQLTPMRAVMVAGGDTAKLIWLTEFGAQPARIPLPSPKLFKPRLFRSSCRLPETPPGWDRHSSTPSATPEPTLPTGSRTSASCTGISPSRQATGHCRRLRPRRSNLPAPTTPLGERYLLSQGGLPSSAQCG